MGNFLDRFHVVQRHGGMALVQGMPHPDAPHDSSKDDKGGPAIIEGDGKQPAFWTAIRNAQFIWISSGFKRYWRRGEPREIEF